MPTSQNCVCSVGLFCSKNYILKPLRTQIFASKRNQEMKTTFYLAQNRLTAPSFQNCVCSNRLFWLKSKILGYRGVYIHKLSNLIFYFCCYWKYTRNCALFSFASMSLLFYFLCFFLANLSDNWFPEFFGILTS